MRFPVTLSEFVLCSLTAMKKIKNIHPILFVLFILLITSCRTLPPQPEYDITELLPEECNLILKVNVLGNEELLTALMNSVAIEARQAKPILERTVTAAIGLELNSPPAAFKDMPIHVAAVGIWPRGIMGNILGKEWKRVTLNRFLWQGPAGREVYAISNELVLMSQKRMDAMNAAVLNASGQGRVGEWKLPEADVAILIDDLDYIARLVPQAKGRIAYLSLALIRDGNKDEANSYSVVLNLSPRVQKQAKAIVLGLRLALSARFGKSSIPEERALLSRTTVDVDEDIIRVEMKEVGLPILIQLATGLTNTGLVR